MPRKNYRLFNRLVSSDLELSLKPVLSTKAPAIKLTIRRRTLKKKFTPYHLLKDSFGRKHLAFARYGTQFWVRVVDQIDFLISADGKKVALLQGKGPSTLKQASAYFVSHIVPLCLSLRGEYVMHGAVARFGQKAVAFIGPPGRGKSTLAAALIRQGIPCLSDDAFIVSSKMGKFMVCPSYPEIRLTEKTAHKIWRSPTKEFLPGFKRRVPLSDAQWAHRIIPLSKIFYLGLPDRPFQGLRQLELETQQAFSLIMQNSFRLDLLNPVRIKNEFRRVCGLLSQIPLLEIRYPRKINLLEGYAEQLAKELK